MEKEVQTVQKESFVSKFKKYYQEHIQAFEAVLALAPAAIILIVFMFFPLVNTFIMSFMEDFRFVNKGGIFAFGHSFSSIGFGEYIDVLRNPDFLKALRNTSIIVVVSVPLTVIIALFISVAMNSIKKLQGVYQTIFFLPYVTNTIALGMVFKVMFSTNSGLINTIFGTNIAWLTDATKNGYWSSLVVLTTYIVWTGLAFKILIFLSGLQSIDKQYYDAARIDGASRRRIFTKITVPLLSPMIAYTVITSFIGAFKSYSDVIAIFGGGPNTYGPPGNEKMWITVVGFIYDQLPSMMTRGALSRASAGAVILLIIILLITIVQFLVSKKRVHY
ncbi:MAG: sugar ABC transporter permease [Bacilli bacterium]|nr:sugar ABC transporter permease [Bacilli bacterium]